MLQASKAHMAIKCVWVDAFCIDKKAAPSCQKLSTACTANTQVRTFATCTSPMLKPQVMIGFEVNGSLAAGPYKNY